MPGSSTPLRAPLKVIIADSSRATAQRIADTLRLSIEILPTVACTGAEVLDAGRAGRPDVVILDLALQDPDAIAVAAALRTRAPDRPPYIIALAGSAMVLGDLSAVEQNFDRVLAKPLDIAEAVATLARLARGTPPGPRASAPVALQELFVRAVRQVLPMALARRVPLAYDEIGPDLVVEGDAIDIQCAFHRLLFCVLDVLERGSMLVKVTSELDAGGRACVALDAAATGTLREEAHVLAALDRMGLDMRPARIAGSSATERPFKGRCRRTGALLTGSLEQESVVVRASLQYDGACHRHAGPPPVGNGLRVWFIDTGSVPVAWGERRLRRRGWVDTHFESCAQAVAAVLAGGGRPDLAPDLVLAVETAQGAPQGLDALSDLLPGRTQRIVAAVAGSPLLASVGSVAGFDVHAFPLAASELDAICRLARPSADAWRNVTAPGLLGLEERPLVMLVDDNAVNRLVGEAIGHALGYRMLLAQDGLDAIDRCRRLAPQVVLMDLNMPVLTGLDAARQMRRLQHDGDVPPFAIIAASTDHSASTQAACKAAGMDAFLCKPFDALQMRAQVARFIDGTQSARL